MPALGKVALVLAAAAVGGFLSALGFGSLLIFGLFGVLAAVLVFSKTRAGLFILVCGAFSLEYLAGQGILPTAGLWAMDVITIILFVRIAFQARSSSFRVGNAFFSILILWLILSFAS
ncbi:MAG: hypothetical protein NTV80_01035, partial [Verrucomicrobia bacterium]|nr:hypothetical protein [Verrucomicrobiota bacterium]